MTFTALDLAARSSDTEASRIASGNLDSNLRLLAQTQPRLNERIRVERGAEFVFARDGSLSARIEDRWWSGCSVPRLAALRMLKKLKLNGAVGCFLAPPHAAQLRVALDSLRPEQAIIAAVPEMRDLWLILQCEDFSHDIARHRLWFVAGPDWSNELSQLLQEQTGLAMPSQFIRVAVSGEELVASMIKKAQKVFSQLADKRSAAMNELCSAALPAPTSPLCVVAPSQFRLWNDVGGAMLAALGDAPFVHFDPDDPACSSPLAFANMARRCASVFTANTSRGDLPGIVPDSIAWITWVTTPRIPSFSAAGQHDQLLLADLAALESAIRCGWPRNRVALAFWPPMVRTLSRDVPLNLAIIADTFGLEPPEEVKEYSSHGLLWEFIREELCKKPFSIDEDPAGYLTDRMRRFNISDDGFARARFIDQLIVPAYQQSIARLLIDAKLPLQIYGSGWDSIDAFKDHSRGPVRSREQFVAALGSIGALVNVWPVRWSHPCEFAGVPVISRQKTAVSLIAAAKAASAGKIRPPPPPGPVLSLMSILGHAR